MLREESEDLLVEMREVEVVEAMMIERVGKA